jgi:hypothetical protein
MRREGCDNELMPSSETWKRDSQDWLSHVPPPPVFFVRVASKGLMPDAARKSGNSRT